MWGNSFSEETYMSINGIGSYQLTANSLYSGQTQPANAVGTDGDADRSRLSAPTNAAGRGGLFSAAISQTLFQIGVTPAASNVATGAAPTNTQQLAVSAFAQNLLGALQTTANGGNKIAANPGGKTTGATRKEGRSSAAGAHITDSAGEESANSASATATGAAVGQQPGVSIGGNLENRLQNLVQEIGAGGSPSAEPDASNQALADLQQSYQRMIASQGQNGVAPSAAPTLASFLQVLSQNLQDAPSSGSLINVQA
jgi:hypothetical protein